MRLFIEKILLFSFVICGILILLFLMLPINKNNYYYGGCIKQHVLEKIKTPRFIIVGGSGCAYGFDSPMIQHNIHMPVVNLGNSAQFGAKYQMDVVLRYAKQGDVVLFQPEYLNFWGGYNGSKDEKALALTLYYDNFEYACDYNFKQWALIIMGIPECILFNSYPVKAPTFNAKYFNSYGDFEVSRYYPKNVKSPKYFKSSGGIDVDAIEQLCFQIDKLEEKGCKVVLSPPYFHEDAYQIEKKKIEDIAKELKHRGHPFFVHPLCHVFKKEDTYDTVWHLNAQGKKIYTQRIIQELLAYDKEL